MNALVIHRGVVLSALLIPQLHARGEEALSLPDCVAQALRDNPAIQLASDDLAIARARFRVSGAALYPAITGRADETTGTADDLGTPSPFLQRSYGVQLTQTLFAGGRLWATRRQALLARDISALQLEKQRLEIRHSVTEAYWRVVALEKALAAQKETLAKLQDDLEKAARHELSAARAARIELLATRVQVREGESAIAETEEALEEAKSALLDAMGRRTAAMPVLVADLPEGNVEIDPEEAIGLARQHRPEPRIAELALESARLGRTAGTSGYYPKVDLNGFYGRSGAAYIETEPFAYKKDWNAGVTASWALAASTVKYLAYKEETSPKLGDTTRTDTQNQTLSISLGDAFGVGVSNRESRRAFHEEEWRYDRAQRDLERDIRQAVRKAQLARSRTETAKARLEEALQVFRDTRSLLQEDRAHLGDLAAARNRVAQAQAARALAQAQFLASLSALNREIGLAERYKVEP